MSVPTHITHCKKPVTFTRTKCSHSIDYELRVMEKATCFLRALSSDTRTKKRKRNDESIGGLFLKVRLHGANIWWWQLPRGPWTRTAATLRVTNQMKLSIASSTNIDFPGLWMTTIQCVPLIKHQRCVWQSSGGYLLTAVGSTGNPKLIFKWLVRWAASY